MLVFAFTQRERRRPATYLRIGMHCVLLAVLALVSAACAEQVAPVSGHSLGLVIEGVLSVASDTTNPPQVFIDPHTLQPTGFDVDLITAMARHLGLKAQVLSTKPDILISDLRYGRYDAAMSAISITPDRQSMANFIPYFKGGESLLVQAANPDRIKSLSDLCGRKAGVQSGTREEIDLQNASALCAQDGRPPISLLVVNNQLKVVQALKDARVVAAYQDSASSDYFMRLHPHSFALGGGIINSGLEGIAVNKDNTALFQALSTALKVLIADQTYHRLILKWGLVEEDITA